VTNAIEVLSRCLAELSLTLQLDLSKATFVKWKVMMV